jgi:peroxiredoxin Q/BCP
VASASAAPCASGPSVAEQPSPPSPNDPLIGKPAPDFTGPTQDGKSVHLAGLRGKPVVVYFYPRDETPGCTKEACAFRDSFKQITATGAVLVGVSLDSVGSHKKFADNHQLPFQLVADADGKIARLYSVPVYDGVTARQTFIIGKDGNVKKVYRSVHVLHHAEEVLADLKSS